MREIATMVVVAASLGACVTAAPRTDEDRSVTRAAEQPMRDLSLIRDQPADVVVRARNEPYRAEGTESCGELKAELAQLDAALGPDLSKETKTGSGISPESLAADLVGGAVGLPFRGVVRFVTGAEQRERELRTDVLAGMVRRGFLKGRLRQMDCRPDGSG